MPDAWDTLDGQTHSADDGRQPPHAEQRPATAPYPPEIADVLADIAEGRPVDALRMRNFQAEMDYLIQSRPRHTEEHRYLSTACAHGRPESCRQSCKYYGATCTSGYEHTGDDPGSIVDQLTAERDQWRQTAQRYNAVVNTLAADNNRLEDERDQMAARLAALDALADNWTARATERGPFNSVPLRTVAAELRAALNTPTTAERVTPRRSRTEAEQA